MLIDLATKNKKNMTFKLEDLYREIANIAYVAADVALTADNHHRLHQTFDICEEANIERINNLLALAAEEVVNTMHNAPSMHNAQCIMINFDSGSTNQDSTLTTQDPTLTTHDSDLTTQDPDLTTQDSDTTLTADNGQLTTENCKYRELIREFLVCRVLHGWLSVTLPESAKMWHERAEALLDRLRSISMGSTDPLTRRLSPF